MKAILINGSPRKNGNTAQLLDAAASGLADSGVSTELINLYDIDFKGCISCFKCKLKNTDPNGICQFYDAISPVLSAVIEADVLILGSPVYFGYITGKMQEFYERLMFPLLRYELDSEGNFMGQSPKRVKTAIIYTMNTSAEKLETVGYKDRLLSLGKRLQRVFGSNEILFSNNTWQFDDYSRYDTPMFDVNNKKWQHDNIFPKDLKKAYELGNHLAEL